MKKKQYQELLNTALVVLGYIPPRNEEELLAFEELHKDYVPRLKDKHVDVDKIINGKIKCL